MKIPDECITLTRTNSMYDELIKDYMGKRTLIINQEIDDSIIEDYVMRILGWNLEDVDLPEEKRKPIKLIINSPGGDCVVGMALVDIIQSSKTPVIAIGTGIIASMAYHIFITCHRRYAFPNAVLLQHDGEISVSNSTSKVKDTMKFFDEMESRMKKHVLSHTKIDDKFYDKHYDQEYYMYADTVGTELGCVDGIIGRDISLEEIFN